MIDPVAFSLGPLPVRWYGLAYMAGILLGWVYAKRLAKTFWPVQAATHTHTKPQPLLKGAPKPEDFDDLIPWSTLAIIVGGRLGYALFYDPIHFLQNPLDLLILWKGGMSFHGGLTGVIFMVFWFCRRRSLSFLTTGDIMAAVTPIGLCFGRLANFINAEHYGRVTDIPWAMIFPYGGPWARHPSQLYEALLEGLFLLILLRLVWPILAPKKPGAILGLFCLGYGVTRIFTETFREPDAHIGLFFNVITWGQILSFPLLILGGYLVFKRPRTP
ncbi:MAG: prolipoprotein diacylglyceryl transferase [bacterium]|nr:prolipoprotein diacylglyceryl transferase [bacterium]